ncbi:hypothetical protein BAMBUS_02010 [Brevundimonas phage vB_BpoS-Bambus]|nr:hypothetical protein BAMBUS_02010 [Brevundimonas phage vB_BpoS-Bambus]
MRKTFLLAAASVALFAGAASAQSVTVNGSYLHNASGSPQTANVSIDGITVGSALTGRAIAMGTSLEVNAADNIFVPGRVDQLNGPAGGQTANLSVNGAVVGRDTSFTGTAGGNSANLSADDSLSVTGLRQSNTVRQNANVSIESTSVSGDLAGGATAFGNAISGESVYGGVTVTNGANFQQSNVGAQLANTTVFGGNAFARDTDLRSLAVGGIIEYDSAQSGSYAIEQANGRGSNYFGLDGYQGSSQTANLTVFGGSNFNGKTNLAASAFGGVVNLSAGGNIVAGVTTQNHNSAQVSNLSIAGSSFGSLTGAAQSIGTSVSINTRP